MTAASAQARHAKPVPPRCPGAQADRPGIGSSGITTAVRDCRACVCRMCACFHLGTVLGLSGCRRAASGHSDKLRPGNGAGRADASRLRTAFPPSLPVRLTFAAAA